MLLTIYILISSFSHPAAIALHYELICDIYFGAAAVADRQRFLPSIVSEFLGLGAIPDGFNR